MHKLFFSAIAVLIFVGSAMAFRATDKVYCLNQVGTACDVLTPQQSIIDRGIGIIGAKQCASSPTSIICPVITIYQGV